MSMRSCSFRTAFLCSFSITSLTLHLSFVCLCRPLIRHPLMCQRRVLALSTLLVLLPFLRAPFMPYTGEKRSEQRPLSTSLSPQHTSRTAPFYFQVDKQSGCYCVGYTCTLRALSSSLRALSSSDASMYNVYRTFPRTALSPYDALCGAGSRRSYEDGSCQCCPANTL